MSDMIEVTGAFTPFSRGRTFCHDCGGQGDAFIVVRADNRGVIFLCHKCIGRAPVKLNDEETIAAFKGIFGHMRNNAERVLTQCTNRLHTLAELDERIGLQRLVEVVTVMHTIESLATMIRGNVDVSLLTIDEDAEHPES